MPNEQRRLLSSNGLKLIACITMLIDHIGYAFFPAIQILRIIGRIAMPIYCFLIAEGARHTHNKCKYLGRMAVFAALSEIPFNLFTSGKIINIENQSVMITLTIGLVCILAINLIASATDNIIKFLPIAAVCVISCAAAELLKTDYGFIGIIMIIIFYVFKNHKKLELLLLFITSVFLVMLKNQSLIITVQIFGILAYIPIIMYNGKKGSSDKIIKYAFYLFYPVHLLIIAIVKMLIQ